MIIAVGDFRNTLFMGVVITNTSIGVIQEIKSKRMVDKLSILTQPKVVAVRNGNKSQISVDSLVLEDVVTLKAGNQICADGVVMRADGLEVDESLLTGESEPVAKNTGNEVLSGSFVTAGEGYVCITRVGNDSYAAKLATEAKRDSRSKSELMNSLNKIVRFLSIIIIPVGLLLFCSQYFLSRVPFSRTVSGIAAALIGIIPEGLVLLTAIAFAVGVINLSRRKTLVQSMPSMENLARTDVLCLDKTGTITNGQIKVEKMVPLNKSQDELEQALGAVLHNFSDTNQTQHALLQKYKKSVDWTKTKAVPFSSARKWSCVSFKDKGTWVLGAPEFVLGSGYEAIKPACEQHAKNGFRVMVFAYAQGEFDGEKLPQGIEPCALILLSDVIRDDAAETLKYFYEQDVDIKIISGDNPLTVSAVAARAGVRGADKCVDMGSIGQSTDFGRLAGEYTVFGRATPSQKRELIKALKAGGHTITMTGDGVNDILALKEADCSIAMPQGSDATRKISDIVLLDAGFAPLVHVVLEGRRVVNNIEKVATLYLVKVIYSCLLAVIFIFLPFPFPFLPIQLTVINALTIGIPSFFLALKPNKARVQGKFLRKVMLQSVPAGVAVVIMLIIIQLLGVPFHLDIHEKSAISVIVTACLSFYVLFRVSRPFDTKRAVLFAAMLLGFVGSVTIAAGFFYLPPILSWLALFYLPLMILSIGLVKALELALRRDSGPAISFFKNISALMQKIFRRDKK